MYLKDRQSFDVDYLDGKHASNSANNVPVLDGNAKLPIAQIPTGTTSSTVSLGNHSHSYPYFGITNTTNSNGYGISLYNGAVGSAPSYGLMFQGTATFGTHGSVTSDWATYFTMGGSTSRGWIFKSGNSSGGNVASISATGIITANKIIASKGGGDLIELNNTSGGDAHIDIKRGANADWRILNSGGHLYFQSNWTSSKGSYYNALTLNYNSGNASIKGSLSVAGITSTSNIHVQGHIYYKSGTINRTMIRTKEGDGNGASVALGLGGATIVGAGESAELTQDNVSATSETLYLSSDGDVVIYNALQGGWSSGIMTKFNNGNLLFSGGKQIQRTGASVTWLAGRNGEGAIVNQTGANGYNPVIRIKSSSGSWTIGHYTEFSNGLLLTYLTDSRTENAYDHQFRFYPDGGITGISSLDGVGSRGSWGSMDIGGSKGGWTGFRFRESGNRYLLFDNSGKSGYFKSDGNPYWVWNGGTLESGVVPRSKVSGLNYMDSKGTLNAQTGRTQNHGDVYSYHGTSGNTGMPVTYSATIGFGRGASGTVEICGEWTGGRGLWVRALRDYQDNWYSWTRILTEAHMPTNWGTGGPNNGDGKPNGTIYVQY